MIPIHESCEGIMSCRDATDAPPYPLQEMTPNLSLIALWIVSSFTPISKFISALNDCLCLLFKLAVKSYMSYIN